MRHSHIVTPCNISLSEWRFRSSHEDGGRDMSFGIGTMIDRLMGQDVAQRELGLKDLPGDDSFMELPRMIGHPTEWLHERFERYGRVFRTRILVGGVFMIGAEANRAIMVTRRDEFGYGKGYEQTNVNNVFKDSIMMMEGEEHARTRGILNPAVGRLAVRESGAAVQGIWRRSLARGAVRDAVDAYDFARSTTYEVSANTLTGLELGSDAAEFEPLLETLIQGIMQSVPIRVPFSPLDKAMKARETLIDMLIPRIEAARVGESRGLVGQLAQYRDEHGQHLPAREIAANLLLLFWAGYDTTASASSWILHRLARRPDWQRRLREELLALEVDDISTLETGRSTPQTEWFLYEIERHTPSVVFFPRIALQDIEYKNFRIPEGTPIFYSPYMSHRDPLSFPNPNCFDPDRWNPALGEKRARTSDLVGFGGGPRICMGKSFAKLQLKILLYELLSRYQVEVDDRTTHSVMALPVHHPVNSSVRIRPLAT